MQAIFRTPQYIERLQYGIDRGKDRDWCICTEVLVNNIKLHCLKLRDEICLCKFCGFIKWVNVNRNLKHSNNSVSVNEIVDWHKEDDDVSVLSTLYWCACVDIGIGVWAFCRILKNSSDYFQVVSAVY